MPVPSALAASASTSPSVSSWRTSRGGSRRATGECRSRGRAAAARASNRLPMLAQAISHTSSSPADTSAAATSGCVPRPGCAKNSVPTTIAPESPRLSVSRRSAHADQFRADLAACRVRRQTADDVHATVVGADRGGSDRGVAGPEQPAAAIGTNRLLPQGLRTAEIARRDPDDGERQVVDADVAADDRRVAAEAALPEVG